ncbi:MAG: aminotransferase class IV [Acidobacteriota bacterium]
MDKFVLHNQQIVEAQKAKVDATLAGLLYGWGVFTTMKVIDGRIFAFDRHLERLIKHADKARVSFAAHKKSLLENIASLISANQISNGRLRLTVLKSDAGIWRTEPKNEAEVLVFTASEPNQRSRELNLTNSPYRLLSTNPMVNIKRTAMLEQLLALEEARHRNFDDAVLLNERGEMISTTSGNIFWAQDTELYTPSLATGCIAGITRALVIEVAKRINIHVSEGSYPITRLLDASEVFITSTTRGITQVKSFDIKIFDNRFAVVAKNINRQYEKLFSDAKLIS